MTIVSQKQFNGWFASMGQSGVLLQNVLTIIMPFVIAGIAIFVIYQLIKAFLVKGKAESPEQRKEAWARIVGLFIAVIFIVVGPTLLLIFMNTIGKTVQNDGTTSSTGKESIKLINKIIDFNNISYNNLIKLVAIK